MKKLAALIALLLLLAGCKVPDTSNGENGAINTDDGKHTISALGKWKYGAVLAPSAAYYSTCKWEVWGLQRDGWKQLYAGKGSTKVELPPEGVYNSAYFKSRSCGTWHKSKK
jgi:hypothetical protein